MSSKKRHRRPRGAIGQPATPAGGAAVADADLQRPAATVEDLPPVGVAYPLTLRGPGFAWWRSLLGVATAILLYLVVTATVSSLVIGIGYLVQRPPQTAAEYAAAGYRFEMPAGMLAQNLAIAALTLVAWFVVTVVHHVRPRWLSSVQPGIRWRYLLLCLGAAALLLNAVALLPNLFGDGAAAVRPQPQLLGFLVVIILTSPLQAAAEEYLFRGYLLQALGSLVTNPWFGVVVSATLFAYLHGGQNLPLFLNRLAFGLLAAVLVLKTGGLEAGIAAHIVNNVSAYTIASLTTSIAALRAVDQIGWLDSSLNILGFALFTLAAIWIGRRLRLNITTPAIVKDTP
jgi:membrane protease YdiL (CAAX protease family)